MCVHSACCNHAKSGLHNQILPVSASGDHTAKLIFKTGLQHKSVCPKCVLQLCQEQIPTTHIVPEVRFVAKMQTTETASSW